jgi:hypothetical protein
LTLIMPRRSDEVIGLKRSDIEDMIAGMDDMAAILIRALDQGGPRQRGESSRRTGSQAAEESPVNEEQVNEEAVNEEHCKEEPAEASKPRSRSRSRRHSRPHSRPCGKVAVPCHYKQRYAGEGCAQVAVMKVWMRGSSAKPKARFCCQVCGKWLTQPAEGEEEPLADPLGDL